MPCCDCLPDTLRDQLQAKVGQFYVSSEPGDDISAHGALILRVAGDWVTLWRGHARYGEDSGGHVANEVVTVRCEQVPTAAPSVSSGVALLLDETPALSSCLSMLDRWALGFCDSWGTPLTDEQIERNESAARERDDRPKVEAIERCLTRWFDRNPDRIWASVSELWSATLRHQRLLDDRAAVDWLIGQTRHFRLVERGSRNMVVCRNLLAAVEAAMTLGLDPVKAVKPKGAQR